MGHKIIFDKMRQMGAQVGRELIADPMNGYLANLNLNDYKKFFRPYVPEQFKGGQFLLQHGRTIDRVTTVEPDMIYAVQGRRITTCSRPTGCASSPAISKKPASSTPGPPASSRSIRPAT